MHGQMICTIEMFLLRKILDSNFKVANGFGLRYGDINSLGGNLKVCVIKDLGLPHLGYRVVTKGAALLLAKPLVFKGMYRSG